MKLLSYHIKAQYLALALSIGFALLLLIFRIKLTHSFFFIFLVWNLFLAGIPYLISRLLIWFPKICASRLWTIFFFGTWLLFLPNSPYIITDLVHLHSEHAYLKWYDLFLVFVFALNGLLLGLLSMADMFSLLSHRFSKKVGLFTMFKVSLLCGYGIYLGRFLRFNSWDLLTKPKSIFLEMLQTIYEPNVWVMTFAFGGFIWILFLLMQSLTRPSETR
ncbi:MAG: DUF1361 domain-containing protein [Flavobacteriaceae bacterium]